MEKIRIQDDLYHYVNQEWLDKAVIPDDMPVAGGFADLGIEVEKTLMGDFKKMSEEENYPNEYLRKACAVYKAVLNTKKRNKEGMKPALKAVAKFEKIDSISSFNRNLKAMDEGGFPLPFEYMVESDMMDTDHHALYIQGPSVILPDVTYYKEEMAPQRAQILGLWSTMAKQVLMSTSKSEEEIDKLIEETLKFDAIVATLVKSQEEWSEYTKMYNPMKLSKVSSQLKPVKFKSFVEKVFGFLPEKIIVADPRWLKGFNTLFNEETFPLYKSWAYVKYIIRSTQLLSEDLRVIGGMYQRALTGVAAAPSVEKYAYNLAQSIFSEPVGLYYGEKYFGEEAKKDIVEMVHEIIDTYKKRVKENDFLEEPTKEKAILKLSTMKIKMGYPDKVDSLYDQIVFDENASLFNIVSEISKIRSEYKNAQLAKDVDRSEWVMPGHMVNACYNPTSNDITFPAAILQAPFYSIKQSRSQNLGGIGAVIGHEISHAFDNNGAKCDEKGNLKNWWTKADNKKFTQKTKAMIKEFDGIELPWGKVNGAFIVSENIADNGGMAVTLEIMSNMEKPNYEEYFINWAKVWCKKSREEYDKLLLSIDVHAPAILRANMQPRNFPEWYETFSVKSKDKMYIAPSKRVVIW